MEDIFKNAYFGKAYRTRDGKKAIYLYGDRCWIEGDSDWSQYYSKGNWFMSGEPNKRDIVSEWQESIDEEKLDELAEQLNPNNPHGDTYEVGQYFGFDDGFKAGYRKAKKE